MKINYYNQREINDSWNRVFLHFGHLAKVYLPRQKCRVVWMCGSSLPLCLQGNTQHLNNQRVDCRPSLLTSKFTRLAYSGRVDLGPLNIFALPEGTVRSWHAWSVERTAEAAGAERFRSWFPCT